MAVGLMSAGNAIVYNSVPWSHRLVSIKRQSFAKGAVPKHLTPYLFQTGGAPRQCAVQTANKKGMARVQAMNSCVSAALGRGR